MATALEQLILRIKAALEILGAYQSYQDGGHYMQIHMWHYMRHILK